MAPPQKPGKSKQDFVTPDAFIAAVKALLGIKRFAFDFAADHTNTKAARFWGIADDSILHEATEWARMTGDDWGWLNPPFKRIKPWAWHCKACKAAGGRVAFLVPAAVGSDWYRDHVDGRALVLALNGRIPFMPDRPTWGYPKDCILALYSPDIEPGFMVWTWGSRDSTERVAEAIDLRSFDHDGA